LAEDRTKGRIEDITPPIYQDKSEENDVVDPGFFGLTAGEYL